MRLVWLALVLFACSNQASEGDACSPSNSTDECEDGLVCTKEPLQTVCRLLCDDAAVTCPSGTVCSGVTGGSHKSCQPVIR